MKAVGIEYVMGYEIRAIEKTLSFDPPARVGLHRMGSEAPTYFSPDEARRFAEALLRAANNAEGSR